MKEKMTTRDYEKIYNEVEEKIKARYEAEEITEDMIIGQLEQDGILERKFDEFYAGVELAEWEDLEEEWNDFCDWMVIIFEERR